MGNHCGLRVLCFCSGDGNVRVEHVVVMRIRSCDYPIVWHSLRDIQHILIMQVSVCGPLQTTPGLHA